MSKYRSKSVLHGFSYKKDKEPKIKYSKKAYTLNLKEGKMLLLPIGIQGSGKSTWRDMLIKKYGEIIGTVSPDEIRVSHFGIEYDLAKEEEVWKVVEKELEKCVVNKQICILDATNIDKFSREMPIRIAKKLGIKVKAFFFDIDPQYALYRISKRERKIPEERVMLYYHTLLEEFPMLQEGIDEIIQIPQIPTKKELREMK